MAVTSATKSKTEKAMMENERKRKRTWYEFIDPSLLAFTGKSNSSSSSRHQPVGYYGVLRSINKVLIQQLLKGIKGVDYISNKLHDYGSFYLLGLSNKKKRRDLFYNFFLNTILVNLPKSVGRSDSKLEKLKERY